MRLLGKRCGAPACACVRRWADHESLWLLDGEPAVWVAQPYCSADEPALREARDFADARGLDIAISGDGWHYPGRTALIEIRRRPGAS